MIYLDSAATTFLKPACVEQAMRRALHTCSSPGRGGYESAMTAAETLYTLRERAADLFHVPEPERVTVTFNATHGLNIAIRSLAGAGSRVVVTGYEHNSVIRPLTAVGADVRVAASPLFDRDAAVRAFKLALDAGADAAVVNHVSNVFGFELPVYEIASLCRKRGVPLIVDASQSAGILPVDYRELGADFIAMPGHKGLYGPQGTGLLLVSGRAAPLLAGGTGSDSRSPRMPDFLPDRLEAGTHNMPGIAGLSAGVEFVRRLGTEKIRKRESALISRLIRGLSAVPGIRVFAPPEEGRGGVVSFQPDTVDPEEIGQRLGEMGFAVRAGLHCSPLAHATAGTVRRGTVRVSVCYFNEPGEMDAFTGAMLTLLEKPCGLFQQGGTCGKSL